MNNTVSLGLASGLFDMSDTQFTRTYIHTGRIHPDRLHQLNWTRVLWLYDQTPKRKEKRARDDWKMKRDFCML